MSNWHDACDLIKADEPPAPPKMGMEAPKAPSSAPATPKEDPGRVFDQSLAKLKNEYNGHVARLASISKLGAQAQQEHHSLIQGALKDISTHHGRLDKISASLSKSANWHDACDLIKSKAKVDYPSVSKWSTRGTSTPVSKLAPGTKGTPPRPLSNLKMKKLRGTNATQRAAETKNARKHARIRANVGDIDKKYANLVAEGRAPELVAGETSGSTGKTSGATRTERSLNRSNKQAGAFTRKR